MYRPLRFDIAEKFVEIEMRDIPQRFLKYFNKIDMIIDVMEKMEEDENEK